jgi:hypothetical protein
VQQKVRELLLVRLGAISLGTEKHSVWGKGGEREPFYLDRGREREL